MQACSFSPSFIPSFLFSADKFFWPLNTTADGTPTPVKHGKHAVNVFQSSASRALARFPNHCLTNLEHCNDGLSLEFWLWFNYTFDYIETRIIKSGKPTSSRGFTVDLKYQHICMVIHMEWSWFKACVGPLGRPKYWLHVLAFWDVSSGLTLIGIVAIFIHFLYVLLVPSLMPEIFINSSGLILRI